jgi:hypothetical protein
MNGHSIEIHIGDGGKSKMNNLPFKISFFIFFHKKFIIYVPCW